MVDYLLVGKDMDSDIWREARLHDGKNREKTNKMKETIKKNESSNMLFTNQSLRKLIIPLIIEQILVIAVGMADTVMIAGVGEAAVSGVSLVDTINVLIINILSALATGGAVAAGHFLGQKDKDKASKSAWQLILFSIVLSLVVTIVFLGLHDFILRKVFGRIEEQVMEDAKIYFSASRVK